MRVIDAGHAGTILDTSDGGQDVSIPLEKDKPAWACVGIAGMVRVSMVTSGGHMSVTIADTDRDSLCERIDPLGGSA